MSECDRCESGWNAVHEELQTVAREAVAIVLNEDLPDDVHSYRHAIYRVLFRRGVIPPHTLLRLEREVKHALTEMGR